MTLEEKSSSRGRYGRVWAWVAALLMVSAALWGWRSVERPDADAAGTGAPRAAGPASSPQADQPLHSEANAASPESRPVAPNSGNSAVDDPGEAGPAELRHDALLATIEKQWCTHYAQADAQYLQALEQSYPFDPQDRNAKAVSQWAKATMALPTQQARRAVRERIAARWTAQLDRAGDPRSLTVAAVLAQGSFHETWDVREARLAAAQRQAMTTTDPVVASIWAGRLMSCSANVDCWAAARRRWQDTEPANVAAWLVRSPSRDAIAEQNWQALARTQYARAHSAAVMGQLLTLLPLTEPGLEREEALGLIESVRQHQSDMVSRFDLIQSCQAAKDSALARGACLHAMNLLWDDPQSSMLDRLQFLGLAEALGAQDEPVWSERSHAMRDDLTPPVAQSIFEVESGQDVRRHQGCGGHAAREARLHALVEGGPLKVLRQLASGQDFSKR